MAAVARAAMASGTLTSQHVNYLIWRYLQESGHGEAAVMLQRAWNPDPQNLPFASHIKTHALITLIQKGLQYHELEQLIDKDGKPATSPPYSFFGEGTAQAGSPRSPDEAAQAVDGSVAERRRDEEKKGDKAGPSPPPSSAVPKGGDVNGQAVDTTQQPSTRPTDKSVSVVDEAEVASPDRVGSPMEVDRPEHPTEPSPSQPLSPGEREPPVVDADGDVEVTAPPAQEPPSPVFTLSTGQSVGIQIDPAKAADLAPDTTVVNVTESDHVNKIRWRPNDPLTVAAAGDAFCGLWRLSGPRSSSVSPTRQDIVEGVSITACDWDTLGQSLVIATYRDFTASITVYDPQGIVLSRFPDTPNLVTILRWVHKGTRVLIVLSDGEHSHLLVCDSSNPPAELPLAQEVEGPIYDVAWTNDDQVFACGEGSVYQCQADNTVQLTRRFVSEDHRESWTFVKTAPWTKPPVVVVASSSTAKIWIPTHDITVSSIHHADITAIELRPQSPCARQLEKDSSLTLATSSMDDTVKLWNINVEAKEMHCTHRLYLGESSPALVAAFSPDGYAVATASQRKLFIWHAERGGTPLATWEVPSDNDVKAESEQEGSPSSEEVDSSGLYRTLSWDSDGKKLALGFRQKMAIINLQR